MSHSIIPTGKQAKRLKTVDHIRKHILKHAAWSPEITAGLRASRMKGAEGHEAMALVAYHALVSLETANDKNYILSDVNEILREQVDRYKGKFEEVTKELEAIKSNIEGHHKEME